MQRSLRGEACRPSLRVSYNRTAAPGARVSASFRPSRGVHEIGRLSEVSDFGAGLTRRESSSRQVTSLGGRDDLKTLDRLRAFAETETRHTSRQW